MSKAFLIGIQQDPREYLPFLKELRSLDKYYQRFRIDDHLKRYEKALKNLSLAGPERFNEAIAYIERYSLYEPALAIWKNTEQYQVIEIYRLFIPTTSDSEMNT